MKKPLGPHSYDQPTQELNLQKQQHVRIMFQVYPPSSGPIRHNIQIHSVDIVSVGILAE